MEDKARAQLKREREQDISDTTYKGIVDQFNQDEKTEKKEEKKARASGIIAAVGDGISALSNLYFTTKGAPSSYDAQNSLSETQRRRREELIRRRDAERDKWMHAYMSARQLDDANEASNQAYQAQIANSRYSRDKDERDYEYRKVKDEKLLKLKEEANRLKGISSEDKRLDNAARRAIEERRAATYEANGAKYRGRKDAKAENDEYYVNTVSDDLKDAKVAKEGMTDAEFWRFSRNALTKDGLLDESASDSEFYRIFQKNTDNPRIQELRKKVGGIFGEKGDKRTDPLGRTWQNGKVINGTQPPKKGAEEKSSPQKVASQPSVPQKTVPQKTKKKDLGLNW